jgi:four helix bundle protein
MRPHKKLEVWRESMQLMKLTYQLTEKFSVTEKYGLISQINRAAVSILANIAEGAARETDKDYAHFITISQGSLSELDALFEISLELKMITEDDYNNITVKIDKIAALLAGLKKYILNKKLRN